MLVYDIVAELCAFIIKNCSEEFLVTYSCISIEEKNRIYVSIKDSVPEFFDSFEILESTLKYKIHLFEEEDLSGELYEKLVKLGNDFKSVKDFYSIIELIKILDYSLETILQIEIVRLQNGPFRGVLNSNREKVGVGLLPRCFCCWERKRRLSQHYNRMDNFLSNFLLIENSILGKIRGNHIFLRPDFFRYVAKNQALKVAATPLQLERNFDYDFQIIDKVQYFTVKYKSGLTEEDVLLVWNKILAAGQNSCDIITFPEALGKKGLVEEIQKKIKAEEESENGRPLPSMIILPSHWENCQNSVTVLDRHGNVLCVQNKQNPFMEPHEDSSWLERIKPDSRINIFHVEGFGRIAILICKDFLTTKYTEQLMRCFKLTLVIVPSFSTGSYDFRQSFDLCAHDDCNVVWINSCAAMTEGKENNFKNIGYVRKRISRLEDESQKLCEMPSCNDCWNRECKKDCIFFETISAV